MYLCGYQPSLLQAEPELAIYATPSRVGPSSGAKQVGSEMDAFMCFMDNEILHTVIENTNKYGIMYMGGKTKNGHQLMKLK